MTHGEQSRTNIVHDEGSRPFARSDMSASSATTGSHTVTVQVLPVSTIKAVCQQVLRTLGYDDGE
jgi:hypothetical protein